jgi:hypothetical protein
MLTLYEYFNVEPTQVGPIERAGLCLRTPATTPIVLVTPIGFVNRISLSLGPT